MGLAKKKFSNGILFFGAFLTLKEEGIRKSLRCFYNWALTIVFLSSSSSSSFTRLIPLVLSYMFFYSRSSSIAKGGNRCVIHPFDSLPSPEHIWPHYLKNDVYDGSVRRDLAKDGDIFLLLRVSLQLADRSGGQHLDTPGRWLVFFFLFSCGRG